MQITININSEEAQLATDGALLVRIGQSIGGVVFAPADPQPAAARATRSPKQQTTELADRTAEMQKAALETVPLGALPGTAASSGTAGTKASGEQISGSGPTVMTAAPPTEAEAPVGEADIIAAANAAVATIGAAGPAKIKAHIAANFTQADGKPGTIKLTRPEQRGALLADLQKIARKELVLP